MALRDYRAEDEDDYYGQGFGREGVVSVWLALHITSEEPVELDVLQDLCGVGYYDVDDQEAYHYDFELVPVQKLLEPLSYASTYVDEAVKAAATKGIHEARFCTVQYDYAYDPSRVKRKIADDPIFIGSFPYQADD